MRKKHIQGCPRCKRFFSNSKLNLISLAFVDGLYTWMCPLCYGEEFLRIHGVVWQPVGEQAILLLREANRTLINRTPTKRRPRK